MATTKQKDACDFLDADHKAVKKMFAEYEELAEARGNSREKKRQLAEKICRELIVHTQLEEEIFYPAFKGKIEDDTLAEAYVEHDGAKVLINDIMAASPTDDFFDAKVKVLSEEIAHHVREEEMRSEGMFAQCRKTDVDLVALRDEMLARKRELMERAKSGGLPKAELRVLDMV